VERNTFKTTTPQFAIVKYQGGVKTADKAISRYDSEVLSDKILTICDNERSKINALSFVFVSVLFFSYET